MIRWFTCKAASTASDCARTLAKLQPAEHRKRVLSKMIQMRKEQGMPPARVRI